MDTETLLSSKRTRLRAALHAGLWHLLCSLAVAALAGLLVFGLWFPNPYHQMAGGLSLFLLVTGVDVVCGPLLTMVIFNPAKSRPKLLLDIALVAMLQLGALVYGIGTVWQVRPLFLVHEVDRFKVIAASSVEASALQRLPESLRPRWYAGPVPVGIREAKDDQEREKVTLDALQGGRDFAERPDFYIPYGDMGVQKLLHKARPLAGFVLGTPGAADKAQAMGQRHPGDLKYLPVVARQDWVAVLDAQGQIVGFLQGDGF